MSAVRQYIKVFVAVVLLFFLSALSPGPAFAGYDADSGGMMGVPVNLGGSTEVDLSVCPQGARVVEMFLAAWEKGDFKTMYLLIDDASKAGYPFEDAKFDFQFMEKMDYTISSIRRSGSNFEFILSAGDWKDGDKAIKKMLVSGKSFKIIMPSRGSFFKNSAETNM